MGWLLVRNIGGLPVRFVRRVLRLLFWLEERRPANRTVYGIRICVASKDKDDVVRDYLASRVEAALDLIGRFDSVQFLHVCKYLNRILVMRHFPRAEYFHLSRTCVLDEFYVADIDVPLALISATIIHEATHARLHQVGIGYPEEQRRRIERLCRRAEIAFGKKVPAGDEVVERAEKALQFLEDDDAWWTEESMNRSFFEGRLRLTEELGAPQWVIRSLKWLGRNHAA